MSEIFEVKQETNNCHPHSLSLDGNLDYLLYSQIVTIDENMILTVDGSSLREVTNFEL